MCGRFALHTSLDALQRLFGFMNLSHVPPRYNVAPTQQALAVRQKSDGTREGVLLRWGLVPFWAKDLAIGSKMINARAETAREKPAFAESFRKRRSLILADGFYEWGGTAGQPRRPFFIYLKSRQPFAIAGLYDRWKGTAETPPVESCTLLTTSANNLMAPIHDRMPVILPVEQYPLWLDPKEEDATAIQPLLRPFPADAMAMHPVGPGVNNPRNDWADLVKPSV